MIMWNNYVVNQCIFKGNRDESTTVDVGKAKKEAKDLLEVKTIKFISVWAFSNVCLSFFRNNGSILEVQYWSSARATNGWKKNTPVFRYVSFQWLK